MTASCLAVDAGRPCIYGCHINQVNYKMFSGFGLAIKVMPEAGPQHIANN
jgi:hypothetical protein